MTTPNLAPSPAGRPVPMYQGGMVLYHGGAGGLSVGKWILPPAVTGFRHSSDKYGEYPEGVYDPGMVYLTTSLDAARMFAAMHRTGNGEIRDRGGDVYCVIPTIPLSLDPDCLDEYTSWCAAKAVITSIVATSVRTKPYLDQLHADRLHRRRQWARWTR